MDAKDMITIEVSPEEMEEKYIARFDNLESQGAKYDSSSGIPQKMYERMTVKNLYLLMAPENLGGGMAAGAKIKGDEGLSIILVDAEPGDSPMLHGHFLTNESFMCLSGQFKITWGNEGEHSTIINPMDIVAVPKGVCRQFENIGTENAKLLVIIHGQKNEDFNDTALAPCEGRAAVEEFGPEIMDKFRALGTKFLGIDN